MWPNNSQTKWSALFGQQERQVELELGRNGTKPWMSKKIQKKRRNKHGWFAFKIDQYSETRWTKNPASFVFESSLFLFIAIKVRKGEKVVKTLFYGWDNLFASKVSLPALYWVSTSIIPASFAPKLHILLLWLQKTLHWIETYFSCGHSSIGAESLTVIHSWTSLFDKSRKKSSTKPRIVDIRKLISSPGHSLIRLACCFWSNTTIKVSWQRSNKPVYIPPVDSRYCPANWLQERTYVPCNNSLPTCCNKLTDWLNKKPCKDKQWAANRG